MLVVKAWVATEVRGFLSSRPPSGSCRPRARTVTGHREFPLLGDGCRLPRGRLPHPHGDSRLPQGPSCDASPTTCWQDQTPKAKRPTSTWCRWLSRINHYRCPGRTGVVGAWENGEEYPVRPHQGVRIGRGWCLPSSSGAVVGRVPVELPPPWIGHSQLLGFAAGVSAHPPVCAQCCWS